MGFSCFHAHCNYLVGARSACRTPSFCGGDVIFRDVHYLKFQFRSRKILHPVGGNICDYRNYRRYKLPMENYRVVCQKIFVDIRFYISHKTYPRTQKRKGLDNSSPFFMFHVEHYILVAKSKEIHPAPLLSFPQPAVLP